MSIKEFIAKMEVGDPPLVMEHLHQARYVRKVAKMLECRVIQKRRGDVWLVWKGGEPYNAAYSHNVTKRL
jgi:hypothetical protein